MTTLRDIGEDALIARLVSLVPRDEQPAAGPGDDCAVIDPGPGRDTLQLLKTDAVVGRVHFLPDTPARAVGWKAAARVVSDFAAMGGRPERFLVTVALSAETELIWVEDLYRGIGDCLRTFGAVLAGGETTSVPPGCVPVISIAATGSVRRQHLVLRSTAQPGHRLFVTGTLGGSGLTKHLHFTPRINETSWLVTHFKPSAMLDLSDGLAQDLPRLATASGCGFVLDEAGLPLTPGCDIAQALGDGEDFEMLFTLEPDRVAALLTAWPGVFPELPLTVIGHMVAAGAGAMLTGGWDHFKTDR
ncbi:MAG: thiamine-phosphate kinase [Verrucomicrobia bacterium]|nr:thiamine-phosphate kinase [Verrucomicrobiota bacterium]